MLKYERNRGMRRCAFIITTGDECHQCDADICQADDPDEGREEEE